MGMMVFIRTTVTIKIFKLCMVLTDYFVLPRDFVPMCHP